MDVSPARAYALHLGPISFSLVSTSTTIALLLLCFPRCLCWVVLGCQWDLTKGLDLKLQTRCWRTTYVPSCHRGADLKPNVASNIAGCSSAPTTTLHCYKVVRLAQNACFERSYRLLWQNRMKSQYPLHLIKTATMKSTLRNHEHRPPQSLLHH